MKTLVVIKPDGVRRNLIGAILSKFEKAKISISSLKMMKLTMDQAKEMYAVHREKDFFPGLLEYVTSGPVVAAMLELNSPSIDEAISQVREIVGATNPIQAASGTIRGDFGIKEEVDSDKMENLIHASDSSEAISNEAPVFFSQEELID
ncbi:MAG: nucleoside-diphosphate kinase [Candidatus Altiarchaeota archaeon]